LEPQTSVPRPKKLNTAMLGIASLILIAFVGLSYRQWEQYRRANLEAERSREIVTATGNALAALADAETGQRGFLLTGDSRYLEPYDSAVQELPDDLADLGALLRGNPRGMEEFDQLNSLADTKLDELRQTLEARRTQGAKAALAIVLTDQGKRTMDSIRVLCARIERDENVNQAQASADGEAAAEIALLITVAGSLVLLFLFALGFEPFVGADPLGNERPWFARYGAAVFSVALAILLRKALTPLIGPTSIPFAVFYPVVLFASWFGGIRAGVLSLTLSAISAVYGFSEPLRSFMLPRQSDQISLVVFIVVGFGMALLANAQRRAVARAIRAENSERTERQRFETTLASIGDAVIATDAEGRVVFVNKVASILLEWPEAEAQGRSLEQVFRTVNETTRAAVENPAARVLREGQIVAMANGAILIGRDGTEAPIDDSAAPIRDSDGNIQGMVLVFRDVSERRRTEKQLALQSMLLEQAVAEARFQRQRLGVALTAGKMGVYELNPAENTLWWSPEAYQLFGVNPSEFEPSRDSFAALIHSGDRVNFMQYWDENIAAFQPINHEFRLLKPGGKDRWISCRGIPKYDEAGSPVHYSGLFLDITERKEAEQVLRQFEKISAAARLSSAIAHEINNPLTAATNLIYLAKGTAGVPGPVVDQLALAELELERVAHATRQALGFYRDTSRAEQIDIPELIELVLNIFATKIAEKKINVVRGFLKCPPVYGVHGEIRQVISNLLANAIEAVKEGGAISVGAQPVDSGEEPAIEIMVADDGHGIAPDHLHHIFQPFFTTKRGTGMGLGLWVAKEIVDRHRGSIEVQSPENGSLTRGATVVVRLPSEPVAGASESPLGSRPSVESREQNLSESQAAGKLG
jgi:PAS domain S-box-containing protein